MTAYDHKAAESKLRREFLIGTVLMAFPLAAVLISAPQIDLGVSAAVRQLCEPEPAGYPWCRSMTAITFARNVFIGLLILVAIATVATTIFVMVRERRLLGFRQVRCLFVISVLIIGPGVVANLILKDNVGRARPREVIEFGGTKAYTPPLILSRECDHNCSFVSGEASSQFAAFFALAFVLPQFRKALLGVALTTGFLAGAVRIAQGGHFVSDVVFAGIVMALTVSVLHIAIIGLWQEQRGRQRTNLARFLPWRALPFARSRG